MQNYLSYHFLPETPSLKYKDMLADSSPEIGNDARICAFNHLLPESHVAGHTSLSSQHVLSGPDSLKNKQMSASAALYVIGAHGRFHDHFQMSVFLTRHTSGTP